MPFDLRSVLTEFHHTVMELSGPLLERIDDVPALQVLQPYRDSLPYAAAALVLLLLLVVLRVLRRTPSRKKSPKKKEAALPEGAPTFAPNPAPEKTPVHGRAIDIAPDFDMPSSSPASPLGTRDFSAPSPASSETVPDPVPSPRKAVPQRSVVPEQGAETVFHAPAAQSPVSAANAPIAMPAAPIPVPTAPAALPLTAPAPAPAVQAEAPEPRKPTPVPSLVTPLDADFRRLYMIMYIDQELTTNFSVMLANANGRLARRDPTEPLMPTGSGSLEDDIFAHLALAALDDLPSKEARLETGEPSLHGQELRKVYAYALERLRESGRLAEEPAQNLLREILQKMR